VGASAVRRSAPAADAARSWRASGAGAVQRACCCNNEAGAAPRVAEAARARRVSPRAALRVAMAAALA
jgi:hypothetical protein